MDESGAVVPGAKIVLAGPGGFARTATSSADGSYAFRELPPGSYTLQASAPDLALPEPLTVVLEDGSKTLDVQLSVSAARHASALVMRGTGWPAPLTIRAPP